MAVNQPLYGLILSMMASLAAQVTYVRPATDTSGVVAELVKLLHIEDIFPNFHIVLCDRKAFMDTYVADADAVYFVGEYRNAKDVQKNAKSDALFMFSGTGMNPFVVTETADIQLAVKKAVQAGLYNSGQDCGRPKVYLVHANKATEFMNEMGHLLDQVVCDAYTNDQALVGPLLRDGVFLNAVDKLLQNRANIRYGGGTDITRRMIYPTILDVSLSQKVLFEEMFAPSLLLQHIKRRTI